MPYTRRHALPQGAYLQSSTPGVGFVGLAVRCEGGGGSIAKCQPGSKPDSGQTGRWRAGGQAGCRHAPTHPLALPFACPPGSLWWRERVLQRGGGSTGCTPRSAAGSSLWAAQRTAGRAGGSSGGAQAKGCVLCGALCHGFHVGWRQ